MADVQVSNNRDEKPTEPRNGQDGVPSQHRLCRPSEPPSVTGSVARLPVESLVGADVVDTELRSPPPPSPLCSTLDLSGSAINNDCLTQLPLPSTSASQTNIFAQFTSELPDNAVVEVGTLHRRSRGVAVANGTGEEELGCDHEQLGSGGKGEGIVGKEEASVESLLGSLMRALNTDQGRADFRRLTSQDSPSLS